MRSAPSATPSPWCVSFYPWLLYVVDQNRTEPLSDSIFASLSKGRLGARACVSFRQRQPIPAVANYIQDAHHINAFLVTPDILLLSTHWPNTQVLRFPTLTTLAAASTQPVTMVRGRVFSDGLQWTGEIVSWLFMVCQVEVCGDCKLQLLAILETDLFHVIQV